MPRVTVLLTLLIAIAAAGYAGPGDLDPTFGPPRGLGGVRTFQMSGDFDPCCIAQQLDGKLLVAGVIGNGGGTDGFQLRRHLVTNGGLDTTFGMGGKAVSIGPDPAVPVYGKPEAMTVQPDGKILVAGMTPYNRAVLWRFTTAGELDTTFGHQGVQILNNTTDGWASAVAVRNGKILVVASVYGSGTFVLRRSMSGSADLTFGFFGSVQLPESGGSAIGINPADGAIYVAGGHETSGHVSRFFENGTLDTDFGTGGLLTVPHSQCNLAGQTTLSDIEVQADGKVVIAGHSYWYGGPEVELAPFLLRVNSAGEPDSTFGATNPLCLEPRTYAPLSYPANSPEIARQADGRYAALAFDSEYPSLNRINLDGSTDTTFDPGYSSDGFAFDVLVQSGDGKVVVFATPPDTDAEAYRLIRYLP